MTSKRPQSRRRDSARLAAVYRLITLLARRDAYIDVADIDAGRPVHVRLQGETVHPSPPVPSVVLAEAMRLSWIAPMADERRLGLTREGRASLRRARSRLAEDRASAAAAPGRAAASAQTSLPSTLPNAAESPLAWMRSRRDASGRPMLTEAQFTAGERLRVDLTFAGLTPRVTMGWTGLPATSAGGGGSGLGRDIADNVAAARARVERALTAVGPEAAGLLIDVCGHLKGLGEVADAAGWPRRSAKLVLLQALTALARHYGFLPVVPVERTLSERLRHWGADNFRPTLDRWRAGGTGEEDTQPD